MKQIHFTIALSLSAAGCNVISRDLLGSSAGSNDPDSHLPIDSALDGPVDPSLVMHYAFEDDGTVVVDGSGRGMNGTLSDDAARSMDGRIGKGLALSGAVPANQFVSLPDGVLAGVDDFTIAAWVKLNANTPWSRVYDIGNGLADPQNRFMYLTTNGFTTAGVNDGIHASSYGGSAANESVTATSTQLPLGVWKHLSLVGSGADRTLYVDGFPAAKVVAGATVAPSEMEPLAPNSWLGRSRFASDPGLNGALDDFRIYKRVLSPGEVADLAWPQHDYSRWRFDETSGAHAADSSDNADGAQLANGASWTTGRLGGALKLDGGAGDSDGPMATLDAPPLAGCTNQLTIAVWVKVRNLVPWSRVFDFGSATTTFLYLAPTDGTGLHLGMVSPAGLFDLATTTQPALDDDAWHHLAVTVGAAGLVTLFVDGAVVATKTSAAVKPGDFAATTENWLGKSRAGDPYFDGLVDDLRISCRAYTADEIINLSRPQ